jgi:hypothetical protein
MHRLSTTELSTHVVWHGHTQDLPRLVQSADAYCTCHDVSSQCGAHQILRDQHTLDHLAFARSVLNRLIEEEWRLPETTETRADKAEWSAFLAVCTSVQPVQMPIQDSVRATRHARPSAALFWAWLISLIALLLVLGVRGPGAAPLPPAPHIASWQTR